MNADADLDLMDVEAEAPNFVQVPNALVDAGASPMALAAYVHLRRFASWSTGRVSFSQKVLAERMGYRKRQSVMPYLEELVSLGFLTVREQRGDSGQRLRNVYVVRLTPVRSSGQGLSVPADRGSALQRTACTDDLGTDDLGTKAAPAALLPSPDDQISQEWSRLREQDGHKPGALAAPARKALQSLLRDGVSVDRVLQVIRWLHVDGRWWLDTRRLTLGQLRKHWATLDAQCPVDWQEQVPLDQWHAQQDAALAQDRERRAAAARAAYRLTQQEWDALSADDREDLLAVAHAPSVEDWEPEQTTAPAVLPWAEEQQRALVPAGWD